jgi:hypothetical protein
MWARLTGPNRFEVLSLEGEWVAKPFVATETTTSEPGQKKTPKQRVSTANGAILYGEETRKQLEVREEQRKEKALEKEERDRERGLAFAKELSLKNLLEQLQFCVAKSPGTLEIIFAY